MTWEGVPGDAAALALVVDDPDAPGGTFTHWVVLDLPSDTTGLEPGALPRREAGEELRGWNDLLPPCPPTGVHHYRFTVYALAGPTGLPDGAGLDPALRAVEASAVARGRLTGVYERQR